MRRDADRPVFRFAPSPNGELHLGHALSALDGYGQARAAGGRFLLRIEDIDIGRTRPEFVAGIFEDLRWLGLEWEEPVLFQSQRMDAYRAAAERLEALGLALSVLCHAIGDRGGSDGWRIRSGRCAALSRAVEGAHRQRRLREEAGGRQRPRRCGSTWRPRCGLAAEKLGGAPLTFVELAEDGTRQTVEAQPERWGDAVIVRKDVPTSYHLAVVVDDAWQGVTHVTRGRDLYAATDLHRLLQVLLDLPEPVYRHHRLIMDETGRKLAKSAKDTSLRSLRERGVSPAEVRRLVGLA